MKQRGNNRGTKGGGQKRKGGNGKSSNNNKRQGNNSNSNNSKQQGTTSNNAQWRRYRLDAKKYPLATCLDGSSGVYYVRKGRRPYKVYVHLQGSSWCTTNENNDCEQDCLAMSKTPQGSTEPDRGQTLKKSTGLQSTSNPDNPFNDWTHVFVRSCDGTSFSGRRKEAVKHRGKKLYMRGNYILKAVIQDLKGKGKPLEKPKTVVVGGNSAGGLATILHVHQFRQALAQNDVNVAGISNGGFFLGSNEKHEKRAGSCTKTFSDRMSGMYRLARPEDGLSKACIKEASKPSERYRCLLAAKALPHVPVPMFVVNSKYDPRQLTENLGYSRSSSSKKKKGSNKKKRGGGGSSSRRLQARGSSNNNKGSNKKGSGQNQGNAKGGGGINGRATVQDVRSYGKRLETRVVDALRKQEKKLAERDRGGFSGALVDACSRHVIGSGKRSNRQMMYWALSKWMASVFDESSTGLGSIKKVKQKSDSRIEGKLLHNARRRRLKNTWMQTREYPCPECCRE